MITFLSYEGLPSDLMNRIGQRLIIVTTFFVLLQFFTMPAIAHQDLFLEYFYNQDCPSCVELLDNVIDKIEETYNDSVIVQLKEISTNPEYRDEYDEYRDTYGIGYPFVVFKSGENESIVLEGKITVEYLSIRIEEYLAGESDNKTNNETIDEDTLYVDFLIWQFNLNLSNLNLPVLTIILAGVDSFNPCAFFILIFLLNLLIYAKSRRRMLLVGGIFIFFSALLYFIFMALLLTGFQYIPEVGISSIIVGIICLIFGGINIKDFFFFKKGVTLSMSKRKQLQVFKQMRELVKKPQIVSVLIGTVILAVTVNLYELICSIIVPIVYTAQLAEANLPGIQTYVYLFIYNIIYVIPMAIIVLIFVVTLGRRKLTEWQGQILKLFSGILIVSFGIIFLVDFKILENVATPILLLVFSLVATLVISFIWKNYIRRKDSVDRDVPNGV